MLSLLSLIIASGTVLRADTEEWEPTSYPDPRTNATLCNTVTGSTLCDPDRILTDSWRQTINDNIAKQAKRLKSIGIQCTAGAVENCCESNMTELRIFMLLARRINTTSNQIITSSDIITFGNGIREAYGLDAEECRNYILILGVELAKEIYVWTGSDVALPEDRINMSINLHKNMFLEKNYMQGLNKIVDEIGDVLFDLTKDASTAVTVSDGTFNSTVSESNGNTTVLLKETFSTPIWLYIIMTISVVISSASFVFLTVIVRKNNKRGKFLSYPIKISNPPFISINIEKTGIKTDSVTRSSCLARQMKGH